MYGPVSRKLHCNRNIYDQSGFSWMISRSTISNFEGCVFVIQEQEILTKQVMHKRERFKNSRKM